MRFGYPLKLHEYLASGRPSVAAPLLSHSPRMFSEVVNLASTLKNGRWPLPRPFLPMQTRRRPRAARQAVAQEHDWETRVLRIATARAQRLGPEFASRLASLSGAADA